MAVQYTTYYKITFIFLSARSYSQLINGYVIVLQQFFSYARFLQSWRLFRMMDNRR
jgi:hypothetical protein